MKRYEVCVCGDSVFKFNIFDKDIDLIKVQVIKMINDYYPIANNVADDITIDINIYDGYTNFMGSYSMSGKYIDGEFVVTDSYDTI